MNKKNKLVALSLVTAAVAIGAVALAARGQNGLMEVRAGGELNYNYVSITSVASYEADVDYGYVFSLTSSVKDSSEQSYPFNSVTYDEYDYAATYVTTQEGDGLAFNSNDAMIYIASAKDNFVYITFDLINKADFDFDESYVTYYHYNGTYWVEHTEYFDFHAWREIEGYYSLQATISTDSLYGKQIRVTEAKFTIKCPK